jgi:hypothetical protein
MRGLKCLPQTGHSRIAGAGQLVETIRCNAPQDAQGNIATRCLIAHGKSENPIHHAQQDRGLGEIETLALVEGGAPAQGGA